MKKLSGGSCGTIFDENLDLAVLTSSPLVRKKETNPNETISFDGAIASSWRKTFIDMLERNKLGGDLRFEIATLDNFIEIYDQQPKIIHIDCHGDFQRDNKFFLAFECNYQTNSQKVCYMDRVTVERLTNLLQTRR